MAISRLGHPAVVSRQVRWVRGRGATLLRGPPWRAPPARPPGCLCRFPAFFGWKFVLKIALALSNRGCHFFSDARFSVSQTPKSVAEALLALVFECCAADSAKYDVQESGDPHTQLEASRLSRRLSQGHFKPRRLPRKERRREGWAPTEVST